MSLHFSLFRRVRRKHEKSQKDFTSKAQVIKRVLWLGWHSRRNANCELLSPAWVIQMKLLSSLKNTCQQTVEINQNVCTFRGKEERESN